MTHSSEVIVIIIVALCTFTTRLFPFALFGRHQEPPKIVQYLGKILPSTVIAILIVYCLKSVQLTVINSIAPYAIAISLVVLLHLWKRNMLLSIGAGTICYMVMVQFIFRFS